MQLHLLLTPELSASMPPTTKVIFSNPIEMITYAEDDINNVGETVRGLNSIVEDTKENIIA